MQSGFGYEVDQYLPFLEGVDGWWGGLVGFVCWCIVGAGFVRTRQLDSRYTPEQRSLISNTSGEGAE